MLFISESPVEVAGLVKAMYKMCNPVTVPGHKLLDIVGTGGDGADTINISTASSVLAAAAGCKVAKFGNRSVSSRHVPRNTKGIYINLPLWHENDAGRVVRAVSQGEPNL